MQALSVGDTEDESAPALVVEINEINSPRRIPPRGLSGTGIRILASGDPGNHPRRPLSLSLSLSLSSIDAIAASRDARDFSLRAIRLISCTLIRKVNYLREREREREREGDLSRFA